MKDRGFAIELEGGEKVSARLRRVAGNPQAPVLALAHGAGNDMHNPFLSHVCERVAEAGVATLKFNFPYKEKGRKAPDPARKLEDTWRAVIAWLLGGAPCRFGAVFIGGKSLGGRMASRVAAQDDPPVRGLVFLGYPLHPPSKPETLKTDHFPEIRVPSLFIQGTRDTLCDLGLLREALPRLGAEPTLHVVEGGDHSFNVPKRQGVARGKIWDHIAATVSDWILTHTHRQS